MQKTTKRRIPKVKQRRKSLRDLAYEKIKHLIITLHYQPGEYLNETEICEEFNFTRSPVHQALHQLASDNLVQIIPRKGALLNRYPLMK